MIKASAIAKTGVIAVARFVLGSLDVCLCFGQLVASSEKVNEFRKHRILVWVLIQNASESFNGFVVLVGLQENFGQNRPSLFILAVNLQQHFTGGLAALQISLVEVNLGQEFHGFLMFLVKLQALLHHQFGCLDILLIAVSVFSHFIVQVRVGQLFFFYRSSLTFDLLINQLLEFDCQFYLFASFVIGVGLEFALLLQVHSEQLKVSI